MMAATQESIRFFMMMPRELRARTLPAASMQKPACMRNTMAALRGAAGRGRRAGGEGAS